MQLLHVCMHVLACVCTHTCRNVSLADNILTNWSIWMELHVKIIPFVTTLCLYIISYYTSLIQIWQLDEFVRC